MTKQNVFPGSIPVNAQYLLWIIVTLKRYWHGYEKSPFIWFDIIVKSSGANQREYTERFNTNYTNLIVEFFVTQASKENEGYFKVNCNK